MAVLLDNLSYIEGRSSKGIDTLFLNDIIHIKDASEKERIIYVKGTGDKPFNIFAFDFAIKTYIRFEAEQLSIGRGWSSGLGFLSLPSIKEWGVLYDSDMAGRERIRNMMALSFLAGEMLIEKANKGEIPAFDLLREDYKDSLFHYLRNEAGERLRTGLEEKKDTRKLISLRKKLPYKAALTQYYEKMKNEKIPHQTITSKNYEHDLQKLPYKPIPKFISELKKHRYVR
ncbi:MAG: hypothetical protein PHH54_00080 [Candidatus Nanoarchaeia archaeon]|nr:hypothetical protein [Candidatus Nanoarchaeia archaeon]MDD5740360.1 hypothetical protein [Candidatus Nanoarchaeia archaeon]